MADQKEDPTQNSFFHDHLTRDESVKVLNVCVNGSFLVRPSSKPGSFALSLKNDDKILHFLVLHDEAKGFHVDPSSWGSHEIKDEYFPNLGELIEKFKALKILSNPISRAQARHILNPKQVVQKQQKEEVKQKEPVPFVQLKKERSLIAQKNASAAMLERQKSGVSVSKKEALMIEYTAMLRACLVNGQLEPNEIRLLNEWRSEHEFSQDDHVAALKQIGYSLKDFEALKRTDLIHDSELCCVCLDKKRNVVFLDCSHLVCCEKCAASLEGNKCPTCRAPIKKIMKVFT